MQQRGTSKDNFPGLWDVSVAGHIAAGEAPVVAALRELKEEIDLDIHEEALEGIGIFQEEHLHANGIIDREFHHCFLLKLTPPLPQLKPQAEEVSALKWMPFLQFAEEAWGLARSDRYVPHKSEYYAKVLREIKKRI